MAAPCEHYFDVFSDDVLLNILTFLPSIDLYNISRVNRRFNSLCYDRTLVRYTSFENCYRLTDAVFSKYLQCSTSHLVHLNLNACYWLSGRVFDNSISRCANLTHLYLLHCSVTVKRLCRIMAALDKLKVLAFTIQDLRDFHSELATNQAAQKTLRHLQVICLHFRQQLEFSPHISMHFLSQPSFLEYCQNLEELHVLGTPSCSKGMPQYLLQPQINNKDNWTHLKTLSINDAIDPAARMFFFGMLMEVCKFSLKFETILQPSSNLQRLQNKTHFFKCLLQIDSLRHLDFSRAMIEIPNPDFPLHKARNLSFLNIADNTRITSHSLQTIAEGCPNLVSINLQNCHSLLLGQDNKTADPGGLQLLLMSMSHLRHINLSGVHVHESDITDSTLCRLLTNNTEWRSISISPCCLCVKNKTSSTKLVGRKRILVQYHPSPTVKKLRIGVQLSQNQPSTSHKDDGVVDRVRDNLSDTDGPSELSMLVSSCPLVEEFELVSAGFRSTFNKYFGVSPKTFHFISCVQANSIRDSDLSCIGNWKHLRYLQLSGLQGVWFGNSLTDIAKGCVNLERLHLAYLGLTGHCQYVKNLCTAFRHFHKLLDFRLEQPYLKLDESFFSGCQECQTLERVCILSKNASLEPAPVLEFVEQVSSLVVIELFTGVTLTQCKSLQSQILKRFGDTRPALCVCIHPLMHPDLPQVTSNIPTVHLEEMTVSGSRICVKPPRWPW